MCTNIHTTRLSHSRKNIIVREDVHVCTDTQVVTYAWHTCLYERCCCREGLTQSFCICTYWLVEFCIPANPLFDCRTEFSRGSVTVCTSFSLPTFVTCCAPSVLGKRKAHQSCIKIETTRKINRYDNKLARKLDVNCKPCVYEKT